MPGLYYEEFEVGETIDHQKRRTVSERDNQAFCDLTMNQQPLHLDAAFAADTQFDERVVNGLYTMALAVGLSIPDTTDGTIVANLSYDDVEHPNPVFHGDTVRARSTVTDKRETSDGERGVVTMRVEAFVVDRDGEGGRDSKGGRDGESGRDGEGGRDDEDSRDGEDGRDGEGGRDDEGGRDGETLVCEFERTVLSLKREHAD